MATPSISSNTTLQLKRTFEAPRELVYRAWTDPKEMKHWAAPEKLVYTWSWADGFAKDTLVTVEFRDLDSSTELVLTHERFPDTKSRGKHAEGWSGCVGRLERLLQG